MQEISGFTLDGNRKIPIKQATSQQTNTFQSLMEAFDYHKEGKISGDELDEYMKSRLDTATYSRTGVVIVDEDFRLGEGREPLYFSSEQPGRNYFNRNKAACTFDNFDENAILAELPQAPAMSGKRLYGHNALVDVNKIIFGEGSKIDLGKGNSIHYYNGSPRYCNDDKILSYDELTDDAKQFVNFIGGLINYSDGTSLTPAGCACDKAKEYLERMGIDVKQPFTLNGVKFKYFESNDGKDSAVIRVN